ncbi:Eco57I restriction-modification methylase domain-containing protein [Streptomyces stramineus]
MPDVFAARPQEDDPVFGPGGEREGGYAAAAARWEALADVRDPLRELLDDAEWRAAAASTLSAHYTPPEITAALWQALADLGFDGGEVLEPGSGAGVTFGTAPESARLTGVEIDPTSAAISRLLAPGVTVLNESFADTIAPDGAFDAVVGNVPFARVTLFDPKHNRSRHRIHNHFLVKSVQLTRPGGVVALITSRHTMDAERDAARRELFESADLLGAVRLPNKAFTRSAGTDVVTDILILRRRAAGEAPGDGGWVSSTRQDLGGHTLPVSDYFTAHPEHVLGTLTTRMGAHGPEVAVDGDPDVSVALHAALRQITDKAAQDRRGYQPHPDGPHRPHLRLRPAAAVTDFTGRLSADADGKLWQANSNGDPVAVELPEAEHAQLTALIELKDLVRGLNDLDRRGTETALADAQRRQTKAAYERYVAEYGALSRPRQQQNATVTGDNGQSHKRLTGYGYFLNDPSAFEVLALEWWEAGSETVHVSQVLDRAPAARRSVLGQHTDDPQQALTAVVAERGHVDLDHIAWMLQVEPAEARGAWAGVCSPTR